MDSVSLSDEQLDWPSYLLSFMKIVVVVKKEEAARPKIQN
jgi:hypothetical protein